MRLALQFISGLIGGLLGATGWLAAAHYAQMDVGFLACFVGVLIGIGFSGIARKSLTPTSGLVAGVLTIVVVLATSVATGFVASDDVHDQLGVNAGITKEMVMSQFAEEATEKLNADGAPMDDQWPEGAILDEDDVRLFYSPQAWQQAEDRWYALTDEGRLAARADLAKERMASSELFVLSVFFATFGPLDLLWLGIATGAAFKLASGPPQPKARRLPSRAVQTPGAPAINNYLPNAAPEEPHNTPLSQRGLANAAIDTPMPGPAHDQTTQPELHADTPDLAHAQPPDVQAPPLDQRRAA